MPLFIQEENPDLGEVALYGPFEESDIRERLNDSFSDLLAGNLTNIDAVFLTDKEAAKVYINPREFWMTQLADIMKDRP